MNGQDRWHVAALGLGIVFASLAGWALGSLWHDAETANYIRVMGLTFLLFFGLGAIIHELPGWWSALWYQVREMERLRLEAARFRHERIHLAYATTAPAMPDTASIDDRAEAWRKWHIDCALFASRCSGAPGYRDGMDGLMDYAAWRKWADGLIREKVLSPIFQGVRAQWADGWSAPRLVGKLEAGWLPPCPDEAPPSLKQSNN